MTTARRMHGFTLIEMLIVVVILAIITAIAYPSYQEQMRKSRRSECEGNLLSMSIALERRYSTSATYLDAGGAANLPNGFAPDPAAPADRSRSVCPADGSGPFYRVSLAVPADGQSFTLTAVPTGGQANDRCGTLTLNEKGQKGQAAGRTVAECWK